MKDEHGEVVLLIGRKVGGQPGAILSRKWITFLWLIANMRMTMQMVPSVPASIHAEAYMAMEDGLCHAIQDTDSLDALATMMPFAMFAVSHL
jgi:hypothetical protein